MFLVYMGNIYLYVVCAINTTQWKDVHMLANVWLFVIIIIIIIHDDLWKSDMGSSKMGSKISISAYTKN